MLIINFVVKTVYLPVITLPMITIKIIEITRIKNILYQNLTFILKYFRVSRRQLNRMNRIIEFLVNPMIAKVDFSIES